MQGGWVLLPHLGQLHSEGDQRNRRLPRLVRNRPDPRPGRRTDGYTRKRPETGLTQQFPPTLGPVPSTVDVEGPRRHRLRSTSNTVSLDGVERRGRTVLETDVLGDVVS